MTPGWLVMRSFWMCSGPVMIPGKCLAKVPMWVISTGTNHDADISLLWSSFIWTSCKPLNHTRSVIFTNGTEESRMASISKENEQTRSRSSIVTTQIQELGEFYPAEPEHQVCNTIMMSSLKTFALSIVRLADFLVLKQILIAFWNLHAAACLAYVYQE